MTSPLVRPFATVKIGSAATRKVESGRVGLDASAVRYAQAEVQFPLLSDAEVEAINPKVDQRAILTAGDDVSGKSRVFNLGVRERTVNHKQRTVTVSLASDEAMLEDYSPLSQDVTAFSYQSSLRSICNYILGKIGASLAPGPDVPMPALSNSENLIRNPRRVAIWDWQWDQAQGSAPLTAGAYSTGGPSYAPTYFYFGAGSGNVTGAYHYYAEGSVSVRGDQPYILSVDVNLEPGLTVQVDAVLFDNSNNVVGYATPTTVTGVAGVWQRAVVKLRTTATASKIRPRVMVVGTLPNGKFINVTAWRLSTDQGDPTDTGYFDGGSSATSQYAYAFAGEAWSTISRRVVAALAATPSALIWEPGVTAWDYIEPIAALATMKLFCDETRTWRLVDLDAYSVPGVVSVTPSNAPEGTDTVSRESTEDGFYSGLIIRWSWLDQAGQQREQVETAGTPGRVREIEMKRAFPGPGIAAVILSRMGDRGRTQKVRVLANWAATPYMQASISLPGTNNQVGRTNSVQWGLSDGLMDLGTKGLAGIIPRSVASLTGTVDSRSGTVDGL